MPSPLHAVPPIQTALHRQCPRCQCSYRGATMRLWAWPLRVLALASAVDLRGVALGPGERGATVDDQRVARDVARVVRQQEAHRVADVPAGALQAECRGL